MDFTHGAEKSLKFVFLNSESPNLVTVLPNPLGGGAWYGDLNIKDKIKVRLTM